MQPKYLPKISDVLTCLFPTENSPLGVATVVAAVVTRRRGKQEDPSSLFREAIKI